MKYKSAMIGVAVKRQHSCIVTEKFNVLQFFNEPQVFEVDRAL